MRYVLYPQGIATYATDENIIRHTLPLFSIKSLDQRPVSEQRHRIIQEAALVTAQSAQKLGEATSSQSANE